MQFPIQLDILDFIFKGLLIGIMASAPMGPIGVLCIQRTLNKGRWYGFITGIGACVSDLIYALFTGFGMSFVMDFIQNERSRFLLQIAGSIVLLIFGIYCYRSDPTKKIHKSNKPSKGSLLHNGISRHVYQPPHHIPLHIPLRAVCVHRARPSIGDGRRLRMRCGRSSAVVVWPDMACRQGARQV